MYLKPKKSKFKKYHKGRMEFNHKTQGICYGDYAIVSQETGNLTSKQIYLAELAIKRKIKKQGIILKRVYPHLAVTKKPAEVRMGKGKGSVDHYISRISPGSIIMEIKTSSEFLARAAIKTAGSKLPFKTSFIKK